MPNNTIAMRRFREKLRRYPQAGLSYNEVGRALKISKSAVGKYVSLARLRGVDWVVAQTLIDDELETRLCRPALPRTSYQLTPNFAAVRQELKRAGVTLQLLCEEYAAAYELAYKYAQLLRQVPSVGAGPEALDAPGPLVPREPVRRPRSLRLVRFLSDREGKSKPVKHHIAHLGDEAG